VYIRNMNNYHTYLSFKAFIFKLSFHVGVLGQSCIWIRSWAGQWWISAIYGLRLSGASMMVSITRPKQIAFTLCSLLDQILAQKETYVDLWCSCQIGDAYIDLSIHLIDTYTISKVHAAPPLNTNPTPRDRSSQYRPKIAWA